MDGRTRMGLLHDKWLVAQTRGESQGMVAAAAVAEGVAVGWFTYNRNY